MSLITILFFFIYLYGLGYSLTRFLKNNILETHVVRLGIGLGTLPLLGVLLNFISIPLDWRIFLSISLALPVYDLVCHLKEIKLSYKIRKPTWQSISICAIMAFCLYIYCSGPFAYPWLEDDDSWSHAFSTKYVTIEKNLNVSPGEFHYLNPYPPGYNIVFAVLHQTSPSIYWTLKFFNGLIIALGYLFFYFFIKEFSGKKGKAVLATFFLAMIPCYLNHFIWAHSLVITLFFPALYTLLKSQKDKRFLIPSGIVMASILLVQPTQAIKFIIFVLILIFSFSIIRRKVWTQTLACLLAAGIISLLWWGPIIYKQFFKPAEMNILMRHGNMFDGKSRSFNSLDLFSPTSGTASRKYTLEDYFVSYVGEETAINHPIGVGFLICIVAIFGLFLNHIRFKRSTEKDKIYFLTLLLWFLFTFLGLNSMTFHLPIGLFAFRFWILFAIPSCIFAAEGYYAFHKKFTNQGPKITAIIILIVGTYVTSGYYKYKINTSIWPTGIYWQDPQETYGYVVARIKTPPNNKVFTYSDNHFVIGFDMRADVWTKEYKETFSNAIELNAKDLHNRLKSQGYSFMIISRRDFRKHGKQKIKNKKEELLTSGLFELITLYGISILKVL